MVLLFFKSQCKAEMKKHVTYWVDISIDAEGSVIEAQCDCAAGMDPKAHCKHVFAVLYAVHDLTCNNKLQLETTCTQELQTFHKAKSFLASPVKAECIFPEKIRQDNNNNNEVSLSLNFDPRIDKYRNEPGYNAFVRNVILNYCYQSKFNCDQTVPMTQLYKTANPFALELDHQYFAQTLTDKLLHDLHVTAITEEVIRDIEIKTRGQSSNKSWLDERCLRLQASNYGKICKCTERTNKNELAREFTMHKDLGKVPAIVYGKANESEAVKKYEEITHNHVNSCGIYVSKTAPFLAASLDGMVNDELIIEIKCPYSARNKVICHITVPYIQEITGANGQKIFHLNNAHDCYF